MLLDRLPGLASASSLAALLAAVLSSAALVAPAAGMQEMEAVALGNAAGRPTAIAFAPGVTDQFYVAEKSGRIFIFRGGSYVATPFLDIRNIVFNPGESGLIGFIFDPDFQTNGYFYVAYTTNGNQGDSLLSRFSVQPGSVDLADPNSEQILWGPITQTSAGHKAGDLEFDPDGMLYLALGDGDGGSASGLGTAQDLSDPRGKILRFDVRLPYPHIPPDNPFVNAQGADGRIWASGFRNPFRLDIDPLTGDIYVGDVGAGLWEEITLLPAGVGGLNAGWPCVEGPACLSHPSCSCLDPNLVAPILSQSHQQPDNACAMMLGCVYRGSAIPSLYGKLLFTDFCTGRYYALEDPAGAAILTEVTSELNPVAGVFAGTVDFTRDGDGELFAVEHYSAEIFKIVPRCGFQVYCSSTLNSSGSAAELSATGSSSIASASMTLSVDGLPASSFGFFLVSRTRLFHANLGGGQGILCIGLPVHRWSNRIQDSGASGQVAMFTDLTDLPSAVLVEPGLTWNFQYWTRDANPTMTSNTSDALTVTFCP